MATGEILDCECEVPSGGSFPRTPPRTGINPRCSFPALCNTSQLLRCRRQSVFLKENFWANKKNVLNYSSRNFFLPEKTRRTVAYLCEVWQQPCFCLLYIPIFSNKNNRANHYSGNDHEGTETIDNDIITMFFEKFFHNKFSLLYLLPMFDPEIR